ncbi:hypothetical protein HMPREF0063_11145 [Aeromicrobium marinum DSM 15272]|uniref:Uncharacterized protein n=2 Tax=Aeromicrobium marinum TaxID=219314 RepID=E2SAT7_9ACTN|nr:hypothetical protein HMPREF0063_11145 [Aeromicrobium marinum DSM 15272]
MRTTMIRTIATIPYELARLPLRVADRGLSDRLPETSGPRVVLDRALGTADRLAGTLLGNDTIARRGADRLDRSDRVVSAARLEREAAARRDEARDVSSTGRRRASDQRTSAQEKAVAGLAEADAAEALGKREASTTAERTAATRKAVADQRAEDRASDAKKRKARADSAARARKKAARTKAASEVDDARSSEQAATEARADADRLDDLAASKKEDRRKD